ncbi:HET-domain-containing protein [Thozetella sp. PMI_491]|nr:HET-domain-containing protein [Thozetella sp. PMI_491]
MAQAALRQRLSTGTIPVEEEISDRARIAQLLIRTHEQLGQPQYVQDAIGHLETILRRVPEDSPDRAKHLHALSFARVSHYTLTNSKWSLNAAVIIGCEARNMATLYDRDTRLQILTNLGVAYSHRHALIRSPEDLDEAIGCAWEIYHSAPEESDSYDINLNNLASRLRARFLLSRNPVDNDDAIRLVNKLLSRTTPGTIKHGMALGQLGLIFADKFKRTEAIQDLDESLKHCKAAVETVPPRDETRVAMLTQILELYRARHRKTNDAADSKSLAHYSGALFEATPPQHPAHGDRLLDHLRHLHQYAVQSGDLVVYLQTIDAAKRGLAGMPPSYSKNDTCQAILASLYGKRYALSKELQDLRYMAEHVYTMATAHNDKVSHAFSPGPAMPTDWAREIVKNLDRLCQAPLENATRQAADVELWEAFQSSGDPTDSAVATMHKLYESHGMQLEVWSEAIEAGEELSSDEVAARAAALKREREAAKEERLKKPRYRPPEYKTEFGVRSLALDPGSNDLILDMSGLLESMLGYDPTVSVSPKEFLARAAQVEERFIAKAKAEGRSPNLKLCHMCRDLTRLLRPTTKGFELTVRLGLPFGNFFQLNSRSHCVACRLIKSKVTAPSGMLHPRLGKIDPEVQGIRLQAGQLPSGESLLVIDYGLYHVGELRIVTKENYRQTLRQAWEMDGSSSFLAGLKARRGPVQNPDGQQVDLNLIKSWLNNCDHNHGSGCNHARSGTRLDGTPITVIDVVDECLVPLPKDGKYFTLSYVWGRVEMSATVLSNYRDRCKPGALTTAPLPRTVRDAMQLIRSLGERFIWVDAICIVQDDGEQKARDIANMDLVYGRAFATIASLHGSDANAGLPGVAPGSRAPQKVETISISNRSEHLDYYPGSEIMEDVHLVATTGPFHLASEVSVWDTRGWIMQERYLSRRCLYFSPNAVYFECGREILAECGIVDQVKDPKHGVVLLDGGLSVQKGCRENPLTSLSFMHDASPAERLQTAFTVYSRLVEPYTRRDFTSKSDIVDGFAGIFAVLNEHLESTSHHGIPSPLLSYALLWTPAARLPRRGTQLPSLENLVGGTPDLTFPSWSWTGWDGPVDYRLFEDVDKKVLLPTPMARLYEIGHGTSLQPIEVVGYGKPEPASSGSYSEASEDGKDANQDEVAKGESSDGKHILMKVIPGPDRGTSWVVQPPLGPSAPQDAPPTATILHITAPAVPLTAFQITGPKEYLSVQSQVHAQSSQAVRRVHDRNGNHCGLWWEQAGYGYVGRGMSPKAESKMTMLGISAYGDAYRRRRGPMRVEGDIPMYDEHAFPAMGPGSGLVHVLVVDMDMGYQEAIGNRCTVAVIHSKAWQAASPQEKRVAIA